jgi:hypothetical protein
MYLYFQYIEWILGSREVVVGGLVLRRMVELRREAYRHYYRKKRYEQMQ